MVANITDTRNSPLLQLRLSSILLVCFVAGVLGCGGSSPTSPDGPIVGASGLTIVLASAEFPDTEDIIRGHIEDTFQAASRQVSLGGMTVNVSANLNRTIPGWGIGGFAPGPATVDLAIDPNLSEVLLAQRLPSLAAHEFHHAARIRGPGYGNTLLEALVSEGLADHFASDLFGEPLPPWVVALSDPEIDFWLERARPEFDSSSYSHDAWFLGAGEIPTWAGYSIGFRLVSDYQASHSGASAASLVNLGANAFRPD